MIHSVPHGLLFRLLVLAQIPISFVFPSWLPVVAASFSTDCQKRLLLTGGRECAASEAKCEISFCSKVAEIHRFLIVLCEACLTGEEAPFSETRTQLDATSTLSS
jgi:hypothetical protein